MNVEMTPALIGLAGVVVGGALQAIVQILLARRGHERKLKAQAYLTFFQGLAATSHALDSSEANSLLTEGRSLVALYGSEKVVDALAESFRQEGKLHDEGAWQIHAAVIKAMREDTSGKECSTDSRKLFEILYGAKGRSK